MLTSYLLPVVNAFKSREIRRSWDTSNHGEVVGAGDDSDGTFVGGEDVGS